MNTKRIHHRRNIPRAAVTAGRRLSWWRANVLGGAGFQAPSDRLRIAAVVASAAWARTMWPAAAERRDRRAVRPGPRVLRSLCSSSIPRPNSTSDFRQMFGKGSKKNFDALIVATPKTTGTLTLVLAGWP